MSFTQLNQIINGDSVEVMKSMPDGCVDLTVTSPPYDSLRSYQDLIDGMKEEYNGYSFPFEQMAQELYRITAKGGVIVWVVGDAVIKGGETGSSFRQALYFMELGFKLHDTMIYEKNGSSFPARRDGNRYSQLFEYMFVFSKGKPKTSSLICDKPNRWAGYTHFGKGSIRNKKGELVERNIKPIPEFSPRNNIWKYNTGKNYSTKDKIAFQHPAIFPEKLAGDHILTWTNEGDVVFDPMAGSGTTPKMALINNRNYVGIEISEDYCEIAKTRISDTENLIEEENQSKAIAN